MSTAKQVGMSGEGSDGRDEELEVGEESEQNREERNKGKRETRQDNRRRPKNESLGNRSQRRWRERERETLLQYRLVQP